jgi:hypothetical protein
MRGAQYLQHVASPEYGTRDMMFPKDDLKHVRYEGKRPDM